jgi:hypothetical protein
MHTGRFGSCCAELDAATTQPPESFFRVEQNGVLYLTLGYVATADGPGFFDSAVLYCRARADPPRAARSRAYPARCFGLLAR